MFSIFGINSKQLRKLQSPEELDGFKDLKKSKCQPYKELPVFK